MDGSQICTNPLVCIDLFVEVQLSERPLSSYLAHSCFGPILDTQQRCHTQQFFAYLGELRKDHFIKVADATFIQHCILISVIRTICLHTKAFSGHQFSQTLTLTFSQPVSSYSSHKNHLYLCNS